MRNKNTGLNYLCRLIILMGVFFISGHVFSEDGAEVNLSATVIGNQEQPKVIYIVPWQAPDGPEGFDKNFNSDLNALFEPVERDEFRRQLHLLKQAEQRQ